MGSGIPVGYPQSSVWSDIAAGLSLGPSLHPHHGFAGPVQHIRAGQADPMIIRSTAGLLRLVTTSLTHITTFTQFANATTNQQNTSFFNGNAQRVAYSLQTMSGTQSDYATHNPV